MMKIRIGIIFGGSSKEREISFAGGRTVYDNLDKSIFDPVLIFVDSFNKAVILDWQFIYKGSIRDFYPPVQFHPEKEHDFQIYAEHIDNLNEEMIEDMRSSIGSSVQWSDLSNYIDFAFLCLHGSFGEDGLIQGLLENFGIPYSGSGVRACSIGIDKAFQKKMMSSARWPSPKFKLLLRSEIGSTNWSEFYNECIKDIGQAIVVRPSLQGSSLGLSILKEDFDEFQFRKACHKAFFMEEIMMEEWVKFDAEQKIKKIASLTDLREGIGLPCFANGEKISHPSDLLQYIDQCRESFILLENINDEKCAIIEEFIHGTEFSGIVIKNEDGRAICLPPTEIIKSDEVYDYRAKYLPGLARKKTPINLDEQQIEVIQTECEQLFEFLGFQAYARIDGFLSECGLVYLNDPNTTSGMLPSSFFFHQAAEIGLDPSQILSYVIWISLRERISKEESRLKYKELLNRLEDLLRSNRDSRTEKITVAVLLGGYSFERHISVESGRNIYEKLASSEKYRAIPVFVSKQKDFHELHLLPINLLLKDNADDIKDNIYTRNLHPITLKARTNTQSIRDLFINHKEIEFPKEISYAELANIVDVCFIALHGRPGEDGVVQSELEKYGIPYNGSQPSSSKICIDKFETIQFLKKNDFSVTQQHIIKMEDFVENPSNILQKLEADFDYPFIVKPIDDGCSSAVIKVKSRNILENYLNLIFNRDDKMESKLRSRLNLSPREEFPKKVQVLVEKCIEAEEALLFLEITVGLYTEFHEGKVRYHVFEPSEALAEGEILSLEEKFLAGEGLNITPARFSKNRKGYDRISDQVKEDIKRAAMLLKIEGYARIDAFVRIFEHDRVETVIIEVNNLPGMTPATCIFHQAALHGMKPFQFIDQILDFSFQREALKQKDMSC